MRSDIGPFAIVPAWLTEAGAGGAALLVWCCLARHASSDGGAWPSIRRIALESRLSEATVRRAVARLAQIGALEVEPRARPDGSQTSNVYHLRFTAQRSVGGYRQSNRKADDPGTPAPAPPSLRRKGGLSKSQPAGVRTTTPGTRTNDLERVDISSVSKSRDLETESDTHSLRPVAKSVQPAVMVYPEPFERFWTAWRGLRSKTTLNKRAAYGCWVKALRTGMTPDGLVAAVERYGGWLHAREDAGKRDVREFIPMPETWLNQRRWESELPDPGSAARQETIGEKVERLTREEEAMDQEEGLEGFGGFGAWAAMEARA